MKYNKDGIEYLRNAIVEDAAKEYISLKKEIKRLTEKSASDVKSTTLIDRERRLNNLKKWFLSSDFESLALSHDGSYYIRKLDKMSNSKQIHHPIVERPKKC